MTHNDITIVTPECVMPDDIDMDLWSFAEAHPDLTAQSPSDITPYLNGLCELLSEHPPVVVPCEPFDGARPLTCYANVDAMVGFFGSRIVFGWTIWEEKNWIVDFEHHAVWEKPDGKLACVSPQIGHTPAVAFLPQVYLSYAEAEGEAVRDMIVQRWFPSEGAPKAATTACEYMRRATDARSAGDGDKMQYWMAKAGELLHRRDKRLRW